MNKKYRYKISALIIIFLIGIMVILLNLNSHKKTHYICLGQTSKIVLELKKNFLQDTVNNTISEIDRLRKLKSDDYKNKTEDRQELLQQMSMLTEEEFILFYSNLFDVEENEMWSAFLLNNLTGNVIYTSKGQNERSLDNIMEAFSVYAIVEKGSIKAIFGVEKSYIDGIVKKEIGELIKRQKFSNDSYIWVNEVINYEGGDNYAIRRIHPNLPDTEGSYLSTDMEDIKGNLPYLRELEGIKENGELFFNYYFKKLNSPQVSEKITYAKLYKDFDWIIAMGVSFDEIEEYTENTGNEIYSLSKKSVLSLIIYILSVLITGLSLLNMLHKKHLSISTKALEQEINIDALTNIPNRRCGEMHLNNAFKRYKSIGEKSAIMMFDIDDFKHINDKYGHGVGDIALIEVADAINKIIRSSDYIIRWGGDEFVGIFPGLKEEHIIEFGEKLLETVSSINVPIEGGGTVSTTISIGFSYFKDTDNDYNDVIKRADIAMYKSKECGKNKVSYFKNGLD